MRDSFLVPIPEFDRAIEQLSLAADALLSGDKKQAEIGVRNADLPAIMDFYKRVVGPNDPAIHGTSVQPRALPKQERIEKRMPPARVEVEIFERDDWRCRFCDTRVISRDARKVFIRELPDEVTHWTTSEYTRHTALLVLAASLDHIMPHSRGGTNDENNLVTACASCNYARGAWTLEEVRLSDPRDRAPIADRWDGLTRLLALK